VFYKIAPFLLLYTIDVAFVSITRKNNLSELILDLCGNVLGIVITFTDKSRRNIVIQKAYLEYG